MVTRRTFGKTVLAGIPASLAWARINSTVHGVRLGACTYSFRDMLRMPVEQRIPATIQALTDCGAGITELFSPTIEAVSGALPGGGGGRPPGAQSGQPVDPKVMQERMRARMNSPEAKKARDDLREWRLSTPMDYFHNVRKKFDDAGIDIYAYTVNYRDDFTDDELGKTFEQAKALGVGIIAASTQLSMMQRLLPFSEKYKIVVAFHGHSNTKDPNEFSSPETFAKAWQMSKYFKTNLDIGHFTAANFDAVAFIKEHHDHITHLHIKDRKRNDGPNMPFGEGDTPIKQVLVLLKETQYPIPALIEYEYRGTGTSVEETKKCMEYMKQALA
ncbi:MAG TPA: TIM barrel protein [Bryobacteraceae bacterium]|nr:TIM barrel protein [Bryobacteraceae bacterium]